MVFADWNYSTIAGTGSCALDAVTKYAGNSSAKFTIGNNAVAPILRLTHDTFSEPHVCVMAWLRRTDGTFSSKPWGNIYHASYGSIDTLAYMTTDTWEKFKATFWYEVGTNTKWGRIEKWVASAWVQQGSDTNFGTGSPAAGAISLEAKGEA